MPRYFSPISPDYHRLYLSYTYSSHDITVIFAAPKAHCNENHLLNLDLSFARFTLIYIASYVTYNIHVIIGHHQIFRHKNRRISRTNNLKLKYLPNLMLTRGLIVIRWYNSRIPILQNLKI